MDKPLFIKEEDQEEWEAYKREVEFEQQNCRKRYILKAWMTPTQAEGLSNWIHRELISLNPDLVFYQEERE